MYNPGIPNHVANQAARGVFCRQLLREQEGSMRRLNGAGIVADEQFESRWPPARPSQCRIPIFRTWIPAKVSPHLNSRLVLPLPQGSSSSLLLLCPTWGQNQRASGPSRFTLHRYRATRPGARTDHRTIYNSITVWRQKFITSGISRVWSTQNFQLDFRLYTFVCF